MNGGRISQHVPQRTCVGCRKVKGKRELLRLAVSQGGTIAVDWGRKSPGRGVYLCPHRECWEIGLKRDKISHSLRARLSPDNREELMALAAGFAWQGEAPEESAGKALVKSGLE